MLHRQKKQWRTTLYYLLGILGLLLVILMSVSLPQWYSRWQDHFLMREVSVADMDRIKFLNTDMLDITARLKLLSESGNMFYDMDTNVYYGWDQEDLTQRLKTCRESYQKLVDGNLMPKEALTYMQQEYLISYTLTYIRLASGVIPVLSLSFALDENLILLIMDPDNGFLYYAGAGGPFIWDKLAGDLGAESLDSWYEQLEEYTYSLDQVRDVADYDFATVCGASGQETIKGEDTGVFLRSRLDFGDFTCMAYRAMYNQYSDRGLCVMFGSDIWQYVAYARADESGFTTWEMHPETWVEEWNELMDENGFGGLFINYNSQWEYDKSDAALEEKEKYVEENGGESETKNSGT